MAVMQRLCEGAAAPTQTVHLAWDADVHPFLPAVSLRKLGTAQ